MEEPGRPGRDDAVESEHDAKVHTVRWGEGDDPAPSYTVISAVSEVTGTEPEALESLYDVVDADALDQLVYGMDSRAVSSADGQVEFRYAGCNVTVYADGRTVASLSDVDTR